MSIRVCSNLLDDNFHCLDLESQLYSYVRIEDINRYNKIANLKRIKIISPDGCANYIRDTLNKMDEDTFNKFLEYLYRPENFKKVYELFKAPSVIKGVEENSDIKPHVTFDEVIKNATLPKALSTEALEKQQKIWEAIKLQ